MSGDLADTPLWRLEVIVPENAVEAFEATLDGVCGAVTSFGDVGTPWKVEGYTDIPPDEDAIREGLALTAKAVGIEAPALTVEFLSPRDWLAENRAAFPPLHIGRFFIYPSHYDGAVPHGCIGFHLDAATAFGSGTHATTALCIEALAAVEKTHPASRVLDMGCGSGLLALAAARLWSARVLAADIDPEAVRVSRRNARINGLSHRIRAIRSVGYRDPEIRRMAPFDVIVANVLARPLIGMAGDAAGAMAPGGYLILSGLLDRDLNWVAGHHRGRGLVLRRIYHREGWGALVMQKPAQA